jgi:hypothetical protein
MCKKGSELVTIKLELAKVVLAAPWLEQLPMRMAEQV